MATTSEADAVNMTTDDGFEMLDAGCDDFMGLQVVEGFDVLREKDASGKHTLTKIVQVDDSDKILAANNAAKRSAQPKSKDIRGKAPKAAKKTAPHDKPASNSKLETASPTPHNEDEAISAALHAAREQSLLAEDDAGDDGDDHESADTEAPGWHDIPLHPRLKHALATCAFTKPTPVQAATIPPTLGGQRDIVGIAQTGSGKTLAYGLPILNYIMERAEDALPSTRPLESLILAPTRELALQVRTHLQNLSDASHRFARIATVCGGLSIQKQERLLTQHGGAHIVVATPGRLWDLLKTNDAFARRVRQTRFLVIDEADRMVETGHFAEMDAILGMVRRTAGAALDANPEMQTLIYSATMAKSLQINLKRRKWRKNQRAAHSANTLDDLMSRIDFRDANPLVLELSPERHVAETLTEAKIECLRKDKDTYLYYLLLRYPGRTLVFFNSIDAVRRVVPLLHELNIPAHPLHGQLQQQQRLRNLDRFRREQGTSVLLATDVAARGIDIESIDHVVHFQIPRSADTYVHRSGRTARAGKQGIAVALIEPSEQRLWRDICATMQRAEQVPSLPVEYGFLAPIRERIALARSIDTLLHTESKHAHDDAWLRDLAQEADLDMDSEPDDPDADMHIATSKKGRPRSAQNHAAAAKTSELRAELGALLAKPLHTRGLHQRYITSGVDTGFAQSMLRGAQSSEMLGVKRSSAHSDVKNQQKRARR
ncbi:Mak5p [Malassezia vespertilionis]|uniref:ATP-dependent RNA helicase n=2 Tax=Malassezia vespertilionis TaxID=2020962 RepID=A0A2N1JBC5_9BASI|nr:Mak5p [Malassezia vespertilionis]